MKMETEVLYADIEFHSDDFFVVTPEGNYFNFPSKDFDETHCDVTIVDPKSHKKYQVIFNE